MTTCLRLHVADTPYQHWGSANYYMHAGGGHVRAVDTSGFTSTAHVAISQSSPHGAGLTSHCLSVAIALNAIWDTSLERIVDGSP